MRLARILVGDHGVTKIRLTGGEPLVRRDLERLVEMLARIPGLGDLAMTTNGSALASKAQALRNAGLRRITVSLDGLDNEVFGAINDVGFPVECVLAGIDAAAAAGLGPIKINTVVTRGVNEDGVCRWPATSAAAARSCASSSTRTSVTATPGGWTTSCRRPRSSRG